MHHPIDIIEHTAAFVTLVIDILLEWKKELSGLIWWSITPWMATLPQFYIHPKMLMMYVVFKKHPNVQYLSSSVLTSNLQSAHCGLVVWAPSWGTVSWGQSLSMACFFFLLNIVTVHKMCWVNHWVNNRWIVCRHIYNWGYSNFDAMLCSTALLFCLK